jgi:hypothetical protein
VWHRDENSAKLRVLVADPKVMKLTTDEVEESATCERMLKPEFTSPKLPIDESLLIRTLSIADASEPTRKTDRKDKLEAILKKSTKLEKRPEKYFPRIDKQLPMKK